MHRSKQLPYSITSSARASKVAGNGKAKRLGSWKIDHELELGHPGAARAVKGPTCRFDHFSSTTIRLGQRTSQKMSAAFEAALGKLGLVDRTDPATMAVAKMIVEFAKQGERDAERLCALALQQLAN